MISTELNYGFINDIYDAEPARYCMPTEWNWNIVIIRDDGNSGAGNSFVCQTM